MTIRNTNRTLYDIVKDLRAVVRDMPENMGLDPSGPMVKYCRQRVESIAMAAASLTDEEACALVHGPGGSIIMDLELLLYMMNKAGRRKGKNGGRSCREGRGGGGSGKDVGMRRPKSRWPSVQYVVQQRFGCLRKPRLDTSIRGPGKQGGHAGIG